MNTNASFDQNLTLTWDMIVTIKGKPIKQSYI